MNREINKFEFALMFLISETKFVSMFFRGTL
jgi:hypothetical protein